MSRKEEKYTGSVFLSSREQGRARAEFVSSSSIIISRSVELDAAT